MDIEVNTFSCLDDCRAYPQKSHYGPWWRPVSPWHTDAPFHYSNRRPMLIILFRAIIVFSPDNARWNRVHMEGTESNHSMRCDGGRVCLNGGAVVLLSSSLISRYIWTLWTYYPAYVKPQCHLHKVNKNSSWMESVSINRNCPEKSIK